MGRAFLAVSDDASASYWNPAAMVQLERKELMGLQASLFGDTKYTFLSYVQPGTKMGAWGFNMARLQSAGFEKIKATIDPSSSPSSPNFTSVENLGEYVISEQAITLAYGKQVTEKVAMGLALKRITNTVDTFSQSFTGVDASVFSKVNDNYRVGFAVKNVVSQAPAASNDRLPLTVRIGNSYKMLNGRILLAGDITSNKYTGMGWNLGTEYWATRKAAFRLGIESRNRRDRGDDCGHRVGVRQHEPRPRLRHHRARNVPAVFAVVEVRPGRVAGPQRQRPQADQIGRSGVPEGPVRAGAGAARSGPLGRSVEPGPEGDGGQDELHRRNGSVGRPATATSTVSFGRASPLTSRATCRPRTTRSEPRMKRIRPIRT